ncbi:MAG: 23S rRNA (guanosine(2251)-2'-O)-methyltransferase RlmB [Candidatus Omnitrophota bacterium]
MFLYGKNSVSERIKNAPGSIKRVIVQDNFNNEYILQSIRSKGIPIKRASERELVRIKRADRLQGIVAEVEGFAYSSYDEILDGHKEKNISLICLDNISDPHNLGSIIRIAACFGGFSVVIPKHNSCEVNDTVMHVASGGENFVPVSMVNNMSTALIKAKKAGYWIVGTVIEGGEDISSASLPFPICLVLGSEGKGIRHGIQKQLDFRVTLPMRGAKLSLNVAMTSAVFCYEIGRRRQRTEDGGQK